MNNLKNIAQEVGAANITQRIQRAETLASRSEKHVGIIGPANSGKSTLLNGILHQDVRTPSALPFDGLPLRVVFDRKMDDERFECVHVFQKEWSNAGVVLYEFSSEKVLKDEQWLDELDILFYLSPLSHFMTAEDRKAVQSFEGIPVQIIATQCDRIAADDAAKAKDFAVTACERIGLPAPIFADPDNWQNVSEKMRSMLPLSVDLIEARKSHLLKIEKSCKRQLLDHIERMIEAEKSNQLALQAQREVKQREYELALATANRIYQEMKLRSAKASNEMIELVRTNVQKVDDFAQRKIAEGRQCKFNEEFRRRLSKDAEDELNELVLFIESKQKASLDSIVPDAIAQKVLTEKELQALKQNDNLPRNSQDIHFEKSTGNELSYLLQSALGIGAVSAATLLSHAAMPLSVGLIATSAVAGGVAFFFRNELSRTAQSEDAIRNWARSCSEELRSTLFAAIHQAYETLGNAMHLPPVEQTASESVPDETEKAARLRELAASLQT